MSRRKNFHQRLREAAERSRDYNEMQKDNRAVYANQIMREYEEAYRAAVGVDGAALKLRYANGWVRGVDSFKPVRLRELEEKTKLFWATLHEKEIQE